jgi:DNA-binding transcriptional LysR family regulator
MELRQLTIFLSVADELHFGRAATRLHLAQSSVSEQVQRLEREIGVPLLTRTSRSVKLTAAGEAFRTEARRLLQDAARAVRIARDAADPRSGTITIGYNPVAGQSVLPAVLTVMRDREPGLRVNLCELMTGPQLRALNADDIDVGLIYGRPPKPLRSRHILDVPLMAAVSATHP